ncbi:MAG: HlyD family efflux transporter periplasmic adaptor subunit [Actinomycetota bacterium]
MNSENQPDLSPKIAPSSPTERLDGVIAVTRTRVWMGLAALAVTVAGLAVWAALAEISVTTDLRGVAISGGAFTQVSASDAGVLVEYTAPVGSTVVTGDEIAVLSNNGQTSTVPAPIDGVVASHVAGVGAAVAESDTVAIIEPNGQPTVRAFVSTADIQELHVGDKAIISFDQLDNNFAPVEGVVAAVSPLPLDLDGVALAVGDPALATVLVDDAEAVVEVEIEVADDVDITTLRAASEDGATGFFTADVTIILRRETPLQFILP